MRIAIDPKLREEHGAEIFWTWRFLLTGMGVPWEEVTIEDPDRDVAYVGDVQRGTHAKLCVLASEQYWENRSSLRLGVVGEYQGWSYPAYEGQRATPPIFESVDGCLMCKRDIIFDVFWLATGQEERHWPRNRHGHVTLDGSSASWKTAFRRALGSSIGSNLERVFEGIGFSCVVPRWPQGKRAAACVGHDVDYPEVVRWLEPLRVLQRRGFRGLSAAASVLWGRKTHWNFMSWMALEKELGVRPAFYFAATNGSLLKYLAGIPDPFYRVHSKQFRELFGILVDQGAEIGLHASYRAFESRERFAAEKQSLERACGQRVEGNRHHYWHVSPWDIESTLLIHEQIGLAYDSSVTHERYLGWRRGSCWPFFPFLETRRREIKTLQLSVAWMDDHLFGHRKYNSGDRLHVLETMVDTVVKHGGCFVIDVHDYVFDDALFPGWSDMYVKLLTHIVDRGDFWISTPRDVTNHWIERFDAIMEMSCGLQSTKTRDTTRIVVAKSRVPSTT